MRVVAALVLIAGALGAAPAVAKPTSEAAIAPAMQGCWNQIDPQGSTSSQMCLEGGVTGALKLVDCNTHGDLVDCSTSDGRYELKAEKFWRDFDGLVTNCDVQLEPRKQVALKNCAWVNSTSVAEPIDDTVYERAVGQ